ncbi:hypothetical protein BLOT_001511 [Blomia tropicalis]|nr:hypothetical protein BLOT_001511 [Blomia tropicalis]
MYKKRSSINVSSEINCEFDYLPSSSSLLFGSRHYRISLVFSCSLKNPLFHASHVNSINANQN